MQFITNGPDIPDALLQAHEEGRVVFFCGAGISYPAGLPGFQGLVDKIYSLVGTTSDSIEKKAYEQEQFDTVLNLLERRVGKSIVRRELVSALQPELKREGATDTHKALLQLARNREGVLRLVTTNFDHIFENSAEQKNQKISTFAAPMLPIPKNSSWDGLVYLHGLLPDNENDMNLCRLVLTSGDFGLAYLTERWAARFVSELFRNYVVCFVGYSINDPVLRYMMDALAADRMLGEVTPNAFAFGDCKSGEEDSKAVEWESKGVTPILYEVPSDSDHSALHKTLKKWAEIYRDGISGKERIVAENAIGQPSESTQQDNFVGRVLWALSDKSGLPAKRFADLDPVPPLDWLDVFFENRYQHSDLVRFGVPPCAEIDEKLRFSLIRRPAPYTHAPLMSLVSGEETHSQWDVVMDHLARWLVKHLNDSKLIIWLAERGGQLHDSLIWLIEKELNKNVISTPLMNTLWRLLLAGRVKPAGHDVDFYRWKTRLQRDGLTTTLRLELREILSPKVRLKKTFQLDGTDENLDPPVHWEMILNTDSAHYYVRDLNSEQWKKALPILQADFQQLLCDTLDLFHDLGEADDKNDPSHWHMPSISHHWQNREFTDWVVLIKLLREAWLAVRDRDLKNAIQIAQAWFEKPYLTFKRLALFAASQDNCILSEQWVDWLLNDNAWCLWSPTTQRETMRLLVLQGKNLTTEVRTKLEGAILTGPPKDTVDKPDDWQSFVDSEVWIYLAKLQESGGTLGTAASNRFNSLSAANPNWKLKSNERDEFSRWMSGTGDPDYEESRNIDISPRKRQDIVKWLKQPRIENRPFYKDNWSETCRTRFFHSLYALCDLSKEGLWPSERWRDALQVWSEENMAEKSWRFAASLVQAMPDKEFQEIVRSVTSWVSTASKSINQHETILKDICQRVLSLEHESSMITDSLLTRAINHPVGHVTETLLNLWFKRKPKDNDTLPIDIEPFFTQLCDAKNEQFRHGRVLLGSRLITLFRVDQRWTEKHLLPFFDWKTPNEARAVWEGFLWSPRLYKPLLIIFKSQFLDTANHYNNLGEFKNQFAAILTYAALEPIDGYTHQDFQRAIEALPQEGLNEVAQTLCQALESSGEQREEYWRNRIQPFWQHIWPKSQNLASSGISRSFARMCIAARNEFPTALSTVQNWLKPIDHQDYVVDLLSKSELPEHFPAEALSLLDSVIQNQPWPPGELGRCLERIAQANSYLRQDPRFQRLDEYRRRHS